MDKYLTIQKTQELIKNRPQGISEQEILDGLVSRGYTIQGLNEKPKTSLENVIGNVADFTGGKELGQGLAQTIVQPEISKQLEQTQEEQANIQTELIKRIRDKKALGEDTTKLEQALSMLSEDITSTGQGAEKLLNPYQLTDKKIIGDALQMGTTIIGAGTLPSAAKNVVGAETIGKGILSGAKSGAITGTGFGAVTGASQALQENKNIGDILQNAAGSAIAGGLTGGVLGAVTGGIGGGIKSSATRKLSKQEEFTKDLVMPKATTAIKERALAEGRVTEQGLLSGSKILPSKRDEQMAEALNGIVSSKKSTLQNMDSIGKKVEDINTGVKAYIKSKKVPFNTNQLRTKLNSGKDDLSLVFASDKQAEKTYDAVRNKFIELVKNKDTAGLMDARQEFDKLPAVKKLLESDKLGENARKEIVLTIRRQANDYISDLLPEGNQYKNVMKQESLMLEAFNNIKEKSTDIIGKNKLQSLTEKYPVLKWIVGGIGLGIAGKVIGGGVGVGSSIIGSTD